MSYHSFYFFMTDLFSWLIILRAIPTLGVLGYDAPLEKGSFGESVRNVISAGKNFLVSFKSVINKEIKKCFHNFTHTLLTVKRKQILTFAFLHIAFFEPHDSACEARPLCMRIDVNELLRLLNSLPIKFKSQQRSKWKHKFTQRNQINFTKKAEFMETQNI